MNHYTQEQIDQANRTELVSFLQRRGEIFTKSGKEFRWKTHDSVTIYENRWFQHSTGKGGYPIDFMQEFYGMGFLDAMKELYGAPSSAEQGEGGIDSRPALPSEVTDEIKKNEKENVKENIKELYLPRKCADDQRIRDYLCNTRKISKDILDYFIFQEEIYEDILHNVVFIGKDTEGTIRHASIRSTGEEKIRRDMKNSSKDYGFCYRGFGSKLYVFEAPIDLLSYLSLYPENWNEQSYLSLGGCSPNALVQFLKEENTSGYDEALLCLDADKAGEQACKAIVSVVPDTITVSRISPSRKDWNDVLTSKKEFFDRDEYISDIKTLRATPDFVRTFCYSEIERKDVRFLWEPYIPFGKITIIQGNPGEGKTFLTINLIASATNRVPLATGEVLEPMNVLYINAEDGLGDTIKPRLIDCGADINRVFGINDDEKTLTLDDDRLELAIRKHNIKVVVMDPLQAFLDANVDMSKPNGCRSVFRKIHRIAEKTGAAIILVGHLNKNNQANSLQRGLGSMDITAAARSILLVGRLRDKPHIRIMVHDKCNIAPKGIAQGFSLETEAGFQWTQPYDIDGDQLLSGNVKDDDAAGTKVQRGVELMMNILKDGKPRTMTEIIEHALKVNISERTMRDAKKKVPGLIVEGVRGKQTVRLVI